MFLLLVWKVIFVISTNTPNSADLIFMYLFFYFKWRMNMSPLFFLTSCFSSFFLCLRGQLRAGEKSCALKYMNCSQLAPETSLCWLVCTRNISIEAFGLKWAIRSIASAEAAGGAGTQHGYLHIYLGHIPFICACINMDTVNRWQEQTYLVAVKEQHLWYRF